MLVKKDIEKLKETFATKEDLKQFATKEDLKQFATKKELKKSAEEVKRHFDVVAEDIKNSIAFLAEQVSTKNDKIDKIDEYEEKIENLSTDVIVLKSRVSAVEVKVGK